MSTMDNTSAVFAEVSGPHEGPGSYLPLLAPQAGLGGDETCYYQQATTNYLGPNMVLAQGPIIVHPGQTVPFTVFLTKARLVPGNDGWSALRGRLEGRAEQHGLSTKNLFAHLSGQQLIWWVIARDVALTEHAIKKIITDAVREELPIGAGDLTVFTGTTAVKAYPSNWMRTPSVPWLPNANGIGAISPTDLYARWAKIIGPEWTRRRGLGDIFTDIARGTTSASADLVCSPAFQSLAAQDIARRYGEAHAQTFREAFRQATAFCSPEAMARAQARKAEDDKQQAWLIGLGVAAVAVAVIGVGYFARKTNPRRRNRPGGGHSFTRNGPVSRRPHYTAKRGWSGGDRHTLYAFTDPYTGKVLVNHGGPRITNVGGPNVTVRIATRAEAEQLWQSPLHSGWRVANRRSR